MATSLGGTFKIGNASPSSLVKSAATLTNQLNTYNDTIQKIQYENSAKTSQDLQTYQDYLSGRISTLNSTGTVADATKSANLSQEIITATHENISADIQRENISIMSGNASPTDKLNLIQSEFSRALGVGDEALGQSLESQAYSLSQTIQVAAQTAANASATLAKTNASTTAGGEQNVATQLQNNLDQLNKDVGAGGMADLNKNLKTWVSANKGQLTTLANAATDPGVKASILNAINSSQPSYQDIVQGVGAAMITAHYLAYQAEAPVDPLTAQGYLDSATKIANGTTTISTLAGSMSMQDIQNWQANPAMFVPTEDANKGVLTFTYGGNAKATGSSTISGYKFNSQGQVVANFTGQATGSQLNPQQVSQVNSALTKLGVSFKPVTSTTDLSNGVTVQFTGKVPSWLKPVTAGQQNLETNVYLQPNGALEMATIDTNGKGHVYAVATDSKGLHAVYEGTPDKNGNVVYGKQNAKGDYGFNQNDNTIVGSATSKGVASIKDTTSSLIGGSSGNSYGFGHSNLINNMVNQSQQKLTQIQAQKAAYMASQAKQNQPLAVPSVTAAPAPPSAMIAPPPAIKGMPTVAAPKPITNISGKNTLSNQPQVAPKAALPTSSIIPGLGQGLK